MLARLLASLLLLASFATAQRVAALNQSQTDADRWVVVSVPNTGSEARFRSFAGRHAVKLFARRGAVFYGVRPALAAGQRLEAELGASEADPTFVEHPAVFDNVFDLQPQLWIDGKSIPLRATVVRESNEARRVIEFRYAEPGWTGRAWIYIYSDQNIVEFQCLASWTDRNDPSWTKQTNRIDWRFGEAIDVPTAKAEGLQVSQDWKEAGLLTWRVPETANGRLVGDSEVYRFRGSMLCRERGQDGRPVATSATPTPVRVSAVCRDWQGHWGPFRAVPPIPANGVALAQDEADRFDALLASEGDMFTVRRPYAHQNRAGNAGSQPVFGHSPAGIAVSLGDPRQIERLLFSVSDDFMRPEHLRNEWGNVIGEHNMPELATWNMRPHWGRSRGGERTKPTEEWPPMYSLGDDRTIGRTGRDNEHWSSMVPAAYLLTGDYDLEHIMRGWVHVIRTNNNVWNPNSRLVDRALGRLLRTFASVHICLDRWEGGLSRKLLEDLVDDADGRMLREGPVRHVCDLTFDRRGLVHNEREQATMNVPFQSIAACGLWAAHLALPNGSPQKAKARAIALELSESIIAHGLYIEDGRAWSPYHLHYRDEGQPIPDAERLSGSWEVKGGASDGGTDWLATWAVGILPIVAEHGSSADIRARAQHMLGTLPKPSSWMDARFWGTVGQVQ